MANGLLGAFLYFTDAVPAILQFISKLMFLPTGDRALGLGMIELAETGQSAKAEDFRTLAMTINVVFEGRWEEGLPQAISLQEDHPAYVRMVLPLSAMRLAGARAWGRHGHTHRCFRGDRRRQAATRNVDTGLALDEPHLPGLDRSDVAGTRRGRTGFAAIVDEAPTAPDWVAEFAEPPAGRTGRRSH